MRTLAQQLAETERTAVRQAVKKTKTHGEAAKMLAVSRRTLYRLLAKHGARG